MRYKYPNYPTPIFRVGEIVYCTKTITCEERRFKDDFTTFIKYNAYRVIEVGNWLTKIENPNNDITFDPVSLKKYFISTKEMRRIKLQQLYGSNF